MGQFRFIDRNKTESSEKIGAIGQGENPSDSKAPGFTQTTANEHPANALIPMFLLNGEGTDLSEILPGDMQRTGTGQFSAQARHLKIPQGVIEVVKRPGQHTVSGGLRVDQVLYFLHVRKDRFFDGAGFQG